jgi:hypothetical protein
MLQNLCPNWICSLAWNKTEICLKSGLREGPEVLLSSKIIADMYHALNSPQTDLKLGLSTPEIFSKTSFYIRWNILRLASSSL